MGVRFNRGAFEVKAYDPRVGKLRYIGREKTREEAERLFESAKHRLGFRREPVDWEQRFKALEHEVTGSADDPDGALVYFIQGEAGGPIKIGISIDPPSRLHGLQSSSPARLVIRKVIPGGFARERELHWHFRSYRLWGEWFHPCPELLELAEGVESPEQHLVSLDLLRRQRQTLVQRVAELERAVSLARDALDVPPPLQLPQPQPRAGDDDAKESRSVA